MVWQICFIFLPHLFEIQLFSSHTDHPISQQHTNISWTDKTHHRLVIEPNTTRLHVDRCYSKLKYLVTTCSAINKNIDQLYECRPLQNRSKRNTPDKSKRSLYVFVCLVIGIPCLLIGIIIGIATTVYVSTKKRQEQQSHRSKFHPIIKSASTSNGAPQRLKQNKMPAFSSIRGRPLAQQEQELSENVLNRYKVLQYQSSNRERPIQQSSMSNLAYVKSKLTGDHKSKNLSTSKMRLKHENKNVNNNINNSYIRDTRSKSF